MTQFIPCSECNRHVRVTDGACPFCGGSLSSQAAPGLPDRRLGRAAIFAFGATLVGGAVVTGCGSDDDTSGTGGTGAASGTGGGGTGGTATGGQGGTAGNAGGGGIGAAGPLYGLPPLDGGAGQGGEDGGVAGGAALYGLPPAEG